MALLVQDCTSHQTYSYKHAPICPAMPPAASNAAASNAVAKLCGCDCHLDADIVDASTTPSGWEQCECVLCGDGRCRVPVSPLLRSADLIERGRWPATLTDMSASPIYCGSCRDHHLLQIRIDAVRRAREKRQNEKAESRPRASRSRSPKHERQQDS